MVDFCFSRPMLERVLRHVELMDRMMERIGVDPALAARIDGGSAWYDARTRCIGCCREAACHAWLAEAGPSAEPPGFCANAPFLRACLAAAAGPAASHVIHMAPVTSQAAPVT